MPRIASSPTLLLKVCGWSHVDNKKARTYKTGPRYVGSAGHCLRIQREIIPMAKATQPAITSAKNGDLAGPYSAVQPQPTEIEVALFTGGFDRHYTFGLTMALISKGLRLDVIGSNRVDRPEMHTTPGLNFLNLQGNNSPGARIRWKVFRVLAYYARLFRYALAARPKIFHILWNSHLKYFDRTLLMLYYKLLGKKIVLTAHDVNAARRDGHDSALNRLSLRTQYQLADHIFVHTEKMKNELLEDFGVRGRAVTVIPYGINNAVPNTDLTPAQAKQRLGIGSGDRTILFFGGLRPYKGLEHLVAAFQLIAPKNQGYRLIIAGQRKRGFERYLRDIQEAIAADCSRDRVVQRIEHVPDREMELYFKAADVLVLPYKDIFQSGVLFLGYSFGLPVIASEVGSLREDVIEEKTGFVCRPRDPVDLARTIEKYFDSSLFKSLDIRRQEVRDHASRTHSWDAIGETTREVYLRLLHGPGPSLPNDQRAR